MYFDAENERYMEYTKLSSGQTAVIVFYKFADDFTTEYHTCFGIANKKKVLRQWINEEGYGDLEDTVTGKCGFEGLIWAYKKVEEFIELMSRPNRKRDCKLYVYGSDKRRHRIYKHFLKRLGFVEENNPYYGYILAKDL